MIVRLACDDGIERVDLRARLARDGFSGARRVLRLGEENLDGQFLDLLDRRLQLGGRRLRARLALDDADDVEAEFLIMTSCAWGNNMNDFPLNSNFTI